MPNEVLIARVPQRLAALVRENARGRRLSTSRYLTELIKQEVEPEIIITGEEIKRRLEESDADAKAGRIKTYTSAAEMIRDLDEYAKGQAI